MFHVKRVRERSVRRWILLLLTLWPLAYAVAFLYLFVQSWTTNDGRLFSPWVIAAHLLAFTTIVGLYVVYLRDLLRRNLPSESQAIWGVLMGLLGPAAMLAYWWRYVLPA